MGGRLNSMLLTGHVCYDKNWLLHIKAGKEQREKRGTGQQSVEVREPRDVVLVHEVVGAGREQPGARRIETQMAETCREIEICSLHFQSAWKWREFIKRAAKSKGLRIKVFIEWESREKKRDHKTSARSRRRGSQFLLEWPACRVTPIFDGAAAFSKPTDAGPTPEFDCQQVDMHYKHISKYVTKR